MSLDVRLLHSQSHLCHNIYSSISSLLYLCPHTAEALSDAFVWRLSDVCLSVCLSRTCGLTQEQAWKTKLGTEVAHVTRDSVTTFKVKRSKVNLLLMSYIANMPEQVPYKYEDIVNLQGAEVYCVATRTACYIL